MAPSAEVIDLTLDSDDDDDIIIPPVPSKTTITKTTTVIQQQVVRRERVTTSPELRPQEPSDAEDADIDEDQLESEEQDDVSMAGHEEEGEEEEEDDSFDNWLSTLGRTSPATRHSFYAEALILAHNSNLLELPNSTFFKLTEYDFALHTVAACIQRGWTPRIYEVQPGKTMVIACGGSCKWTCNTEWVKNKVMLDRVGEGYDRNNGHNHALEPLDYRGGSTSRVDAPGSAKGKEKAIYRERDDEEEEDDQTMVDGDDGPGGVLQRRRSLSRRSKSVGRGRFTPSPFEDRGKRESSKSRQDREWLHTNFQHYLESAKLPLPSIGTAYSIRLLFKAYILAYAQREQFFVSFDDRTKRRHLIVRCQSHACKWFVEGEITDPTAASNDDGEFQVKDLQKYHSDHDLPVKGFVLDDGRKLLDRLETGPVEEEEDEEIAEVEEEEIAEVEEEEVATIVAGPSGSRPRQSAILRTRDEEGFPKLSSFWDSADDFVAIASEAATRNYPFNVVNSLRIRYQRHQLGNTFIRWGCTEKGGRNNNGVAPCEFVWEVKPTKLRGTEMWKVVDVSKEHSRDCLFHPQYAASPVKIKDEPVARGKRKRVEDGTSGMEDETNGESDVVGMTPSKKKPVSRPRINPLPLSNSATTSKPPSQTDPPPRNPPPVFHYPVPTRWELAVRPRGLYTPPYYPTDEPWEDQLSLLLAPLLATQVPEKKNHAACFIGIGITEARDFAQLLEFIWRDEKRGKNEWAEIKDELLRLKFPRIECDMFPRKVKKLGETLRIDELE